MLKYFTLIVSMLILSACSNQTSEKTSNQAQVDVSALSSPVESSNLAEYSFGEAIIKGSAVADKTFTFAKGLESSPSNISLVNDENNAFSLLSATGCNRQLTRSTDKCYPKIRFLKKSEVGEYSATLTVGDESNATVITLSAVVVDPSAPSVTSLIVYDSSTAIESLSFGSLLAKASVMKTLTIRNEGTGTFKALSLSLGSSSNFKSSSDTCSGSDLAKGKSCFIRVTATADAAAPQEESVRSVNLNVGSKVIPLSVILTAAPPLGTGSGMASIKVYEGTDEKDNQQNAVDFGSMNKNLSLVKTLTIKNEGSGVSGDINAALIGDAFSITSNTCSAPLASNRSCYIKIKASSGAGSSQDEIKTGSLTLQTNKIVTLKMTILGTPVVVGAPILKFFESAIEKTSLEFGSISSGTIQKTISIRNDGTAALNSPATLSGDSAFIISSSTCTSLAVDKTCYVRVSLKTTGEIPGAKAATLTMGSFSMTLTGSIAGEQTIITYEPQYSIWGSCQREGQTLEACGGIGEKKRVIELCKRLVNGQVNGQGTPEDCQSFNLSSNLVQSCNSPEGAISQSIDHGVIDTFCSAGQSSGTTVLSCHNYAHDESGVCVENTYQASYPENILQPCDGTVEVQASSCNQNFGSFASVDTSLCPQVVSYSSPSGIKTEDLGNGTRYISCQYGSIGGPVDHVECHPGFHRNGDVCDANSYAAQSYPANDLLACAGSRYVQASLCVETTTLEQVDASNCPEEFQQSPSGSISVAVTGGNEVTTCQEGQTTGSMELVCSGGYSLENGACVSAGYNTGALQLVQDMAPGTYQQLTRASRCIADQIYDEYMCYDVGLQPIYNYDYGYNSFEGCGAENVTEQECSNLGGLTYYDWNYGEERTLTMQYIAPTYITIPYSPSIFSLHDEDKIFLSVTSGFSNGIPNTTPAQNIGIYTIDSSQQRVKIYSSGSYQIYSNYGSVKIGSNTFFVVMDQALCPINVYLPDAACYKIMKTNGSEEGTSVLSNLSLKSVISIQADSQSIYVLGIKGGESLHRIFKLSPSGSIENFTATLSSEEISYSNWSGLLSVQNEIMMMKGSYSTSYGSELYKLNKSTMTFSLMADLSPAQGSQQYNTYFSENIHMSQSMDAAAQFIKDSDGSILTKFYFNPGTGYINGLFRITANAVTPVKVDLSSNTAFRKLGNRLYTVSSSSTGGGFVYGVGLNGTPDVAPYIFYVVQEEFNQGIQSVGLNLEEYSDENNREIFLSSPIIHNNNLYFIYSIRANSYYYGSSYVASYLMKVDINGNLTKAASLGSSEAYGNGGWMNVNHNASLQSYGNNLLIFGSFFGTTSDYGYEQEHFYISLSSVYNTSTGLVNKLSSMPNVNSNNIRDIDQSNSDFKSGNRVIGNTLYLFNVYRSTGYNNATSFGSGELYKFVLPAE